MVNGLKFGVVCIDASIVRSEFVDAEESGSRALSPDLLTPAQYYRALPPTPYHRLLLAVLEDAIHCFQRNLQAKRGQRRVVFREVKEWLFDTNGKAFMSFPVICESLGIEAPLLRRHLRQWEVRTLRGVEVRRLPRRTPIANDKRIAWKMTGDIRPAAGQTARSLRKRNLFCLV